MNNMPDSVNEENRKMIRDLFDWLVDPCLGEFLCSRNCLEVADRSCVQQFVILAVKYDSKQCFGFDTLYKNI